MTHQFTCEVCGTKILQERVQGRKCQYCSPTCRNAAKYWAAYCREMDKIHLSESGRKKWAAMLFHFRNGL